MSNKTARLYSLLDAGCYTDGEATKRLVQALKLGELGSGLLFNCFEKVMQTAFTGIENYVASMLDAGAARAHLSGSGPTLFAIEKDESKAEAIVDRLNSAGHTAFLQKTVEGHSA
jgi:4-diphosphocytidyl-2C-methyl-D-erythritol kinase